ncbi:zinc finger, CCHC-type containing protein [Tanacetum coccineum]
MVAKTIEKFKARLVIQGFRQNSGIDYFDTYAPMVDLTKEFLSSRFSMKNMGEADVILDIRIKYESNGIEISQSYYIEKVLKKFNYFDCTPMSTPMDTMGKLSRYTSNPGTRHWKAIQRWLGSRVAGKEVKWLKNLILNIPLWSKPIAPISILCDSVAILAKAYSQMYNGKSRHLGVMHNIIREFIMNGVVSIEFVGSQQNFVDHLTNGLARDLVIKPAEGIGLGFYDLVGKSNIQGVCGALDGAITHPDDQVTPNLVKLVKMGPYGELYGVVSPLDELDTPKLVKLVNISGPSGELDGTPTLLDGRDTTKTVETYLVCTQNL